MKIFLIAADVGEKRYWMISSKFNYFSAVKDGETSIFRQLKNAEEVVAKDDKIRKNPSKYIHSGVHGGITIRTEEGYVRINDYVLSVVPCSVIEDEVL